MEEDVYVVRVKKNDPKESWRKLSPPSEDRYSASFVLGLGSIHVALGAVSAVFAIIALFIETEANQYAVGLWTGVIYVGCGVTGVLAYTKWYVRRQIAIFLVSSILALLAALVSMSMTGFGVYSRIQRIEYRRHQHMVSPYITNFNEKSENVGAGTITINIFVTTVLELILSLLSIRVAFKGYKKREYVFARTLTSSLRRGFNVPKDRQFVLEKDLPPGYSPGILSGPDLVCHLSNPLTNQYHVTRANPLCSEIMKKNNDSGNDVEVDDASSDGKEDGFFSLSTMSMDDKVHRFLAQAVELANQNSKSVTLDPPPPPDPGSDFS